MGDLLAGVAGALLIRHMGCDRATTTAAGDALEVAPKARGALSTARQLMLQSKPAGPLVAARQAARQASQSLPVAEVLWPVQERLGAMDHAHAAALRVLRGHLCAGNGPTALATWQAVRHSFRDDRPPAERWRLASLLVDAEARPVLESLARDAQAEDLVAKAHRRLDTLRAEAQDSAPPSDDRQAPHQPGTFGHHCGQDHIPSPLRAPRPPSPSA